MFLDVAVILVTAFMLILGVSFVILGVKEISPVIAFMGVLLIISTLLLLHLLCVNNVISICPASYVAGCSK